MRSARVELILDTLRAVRGARDLSKATDQVAGSLADTAREGVRAGHAIDDAGDEMTEAARAAAAYDRQIEQLTQSMRGLAIQSAAVADVDVAKKMREQERQLRQVTKQRKLIGDSDVDRIGVDTGARLALSTATGFVGTLSASVKGGAIGPAVGVIVTAMAPTLGAGIAGAVVGGVGIGGVVGGAMLAARDPRVKAAGTQLGAYVLADLEDRASGFVTPMLHGIDRVRTEWATLGPDLDRVFKSSRFVDPLIDGTMLGIRRIVAGAADAVDAADPVIDQFANTVDRIGGAVGNTFSVLATDAQAGASAIDDLTSATENLIIVTTEMIHVLATAKDGADDFDRVLDHGRYNMEKNLGAMFGMKNGLDLTADGFERGSREAEAYQRKTLGTATAADLAVLKQAELARTLEETGDATNSTAVNAAMMTARLGTMKDATAAVTQAQQYLKATMVDLGAGADMARERTNALRQAQDILYGATMRGADANVAFQASWDDLSASVKANKATLDVHTAAGRANRGALVGLLKSTNDLYFAEIETGMSVEQATKKHNNRITAVKEEARRVGLNRDRTNELIKTYGRIPPKKTTDLVLASVDKVADALLDLAAIQVHLAKGTPISGSLKRRLSAAQYGMPDTKRAHGGPLPGHAPHDRADNMIYAGTPGEWVIQRPTVRKVEQTHGSGAMNYFNKYGELPAYATGGKLARAAFGPSMLYRVNAGMTKVPTDAQAIGAVPFTSGNWPPGPGAQRGDSGVWRQIVALIRSTGPMSGTFGNAYRGGDPLWHGSGRAVDWMGFNQDALASFLAARRPLELIHRTRNRDYAYTRGRNMGSFNASLMEAHRNHIHIAMANGGIIREPVFGVGRSGATYSLGEGYRPERVTPMSQSGGLPTGRAGATVSVVNHFTINGGSQSAGQIAQEVSRILGRQSELYLRAGS